METAKLFINGRSQAVRLPKEFRFTGSEVFVKKLYNTVILIPKNDPWGSFVDSLDYFSKDLLNPRLQLKHEWTKN